MRENNNKTWNKKKKNITEIRDKVRKLKIRKQETEKE